MHRTVRVVALVVAIAATAAGAADLPVAGSRVILRRHGMHEKLYFFSRDAGWTVPPASSGSPGPVEIDVSSPAHPDPVTVHVPAVSGRVGWTAGFTGHGVYSLLDRWKFRNASAPNGFSTIGTITWTEASSFKLVVRTALLDLGATQGGFRIRVTDAGGNRYCARFDTSAIVADVAGYFSARNAASAALADCSAASLGEPGTTSCSVGSDGFTCGGSCLSDQQCIYNIGSGACSCTGGTGLTCGDSAPVCNGYCPPGMHCGGTSLESVLGRGCGCVPDSETACGDSDYPTCGGACSDPTKVCRPRIETVSILPTASGCSCSPPGACAIPIGNPGFGLCGPGADCPSGQICASGISSAGCFAQCAP
jgi:hypothetical protein